MDSEDNVSLPLDEEDNEAIARLAPADVAAIDALILAQLSSRFQKTAMVVIRAMQACGEEYDAIPDVFFGQRIIALADQGRLDSAGDLRRMRWSEVRSIDPPTGDQSGL